MPIHLYSISSQCPKIVSPNILNISRASKISANNKDKGKLFWLKSLYYNTSPVWSIHQEEFFSHENF